MSEVIGQALRAYGEVAAVYGLPALTSDTWRILAGRIAQADAVLLLSGAEVESGWALVQRDRPLALRIGTQGGALLRPGVRIMAAETLLAGGLSLHLAQDGPDDVSWRCVGPAAASPPARIAALARTAEAAEAVLVGFVEHAAEEPAKAIRHAVAWRIHAEPLALTAGLAAEVPSATPQAKGKQKDKKKSAAALPQPSLAAGLAEPWSSRFLGFR
ncbi:hypothetical protein [Falsiroseomonas sp.]|uniref:hypothetical protein n=1 Tax=Falsiroseomonas sp. TaxID=2870721 RepID=UPI003F7083A8